MSFVSSRRRLRVGDGVLVGGAVSRRRSKPDSFLATEIPGVRGERERERATAAEASAGKTLASHANFLGSAAKNGHTGHSGHQLQVPHIAQRCETAVRAPEGRLRHP